MRDVVQMIEIQAESERSWEDAAARVVKDLGCELVKNINSMHLANLPSEGESGGMLRYRIEARVSLSRSALGSAKHAGSSDDRYQRLAG